MPRDSTLPGILIELKVYGDCNENLLKDYSIEALNQINEKKYESEMSLKGINKIIKYGLLLVKRMLK